MADVFISYARGDRAAVSRLATALEHAGWSVWWDRHIAGGAAYARVIEQELNAAGAVIVAWSRESVESDWVKDEAASARDRGKLLPVSLDGTPAPLGFRQYQLIDFAKWSGDTASGAFADLQSTLEARVAAGTPHARAPEPAGIPNRRGRLAAVIGVSLAAAALALLLMMRSNRDNEQRAGQPAVADNVSPLAEVAPATSIAVLPFDNYSPDPNDAYFAAGVTEEITNQLSRIGELTVLSRVAVERAMKTEDSLEGIARRLRAGSVVEGSVRMAGQRVRIAAQLVDVSNGQHLWSQSFDRELDDIFQIQTDVALAIGAALVTQLSSSERRQIETPLTDNVGAYQLYLKQKTLAGNVPEQNDEGIRLLNQALELDPRFAAALARLAWRYNWRYWLSGEPSAADRAMALAQESLVVNPELADAQYALGSALISRDRFTEANEAYQRSLELDPGFRGALTDSSLLLALQGSLATSLERAFRAVQLNPNLPTERWHAHIPLLALGDVERARGWLDLAAAEGMELPRLELARVQTEMLAGDRDRAVALARSVLDRHGEDLEPRDWARSLLFNLGEWHSVRAGIESMGRATPQTYFEFPLPRQYRTLLGFVIAEDGRREEAERAFEASLAADREALAIDDSIPYRWIDMASIHAYRGDRARALEALQKAVDRGFLFDFALRTDPMFATLQTDTGFRQILERIASRKRELQADAERSGALAPYDRLITAGPVGGTASR